ncbi:hypothetical protein GP486_007019, partial [Trichoglossum hirsutum]
IVFVHGLQGHPQDTWTYKLKSARTPPEQVLSPPLEASKSYETRALNWVRIPSKRKRPEPEPSEEVDVDQADSKEEGGGQGKDVFWPRDLLKIDFPKARIMTFGYNTSITRGYRAVHQGNIFSHARDLLYGLEEKRRKVAGRGLVFIAHSLGGILVKEVLRRSEADPDPKINKIFTSTTGIFFFGTPHRGSKEWASFAEGVAGVAGRLFGVDTNNQVIHALLPSGPELELCRESFTTQWVKRGNSIVVRTFQESKGVTGVRWGEFSKLIVPPDSSTLDHPNQRARTINEDHIGMVKFNGRDNMAYQMVRGDIEQLIEDGQIAKEMRDAAAIINMAKEDRECIQHLRITDPRDDKKRIEETKGGLLKDSYHWILKNSDFQEWRTDEQSRLLWIKGDPGKGKTMLLCGIVNELEKSMAKADLLSYFFCQATDSRINNATAVLRGLMYLLVDQQPSLISHIRKKHDHVGKALFEDTNAWAALSEIFTNILQDSKLKSTYLVVDALDECIADLPKLLNFIVRMSSGPARVRLIVSSRNWPNIEKDLDTATQKVRLCLELNEKSISTAVDTYIQFKVDWLAERNKYNNATREDVQHFLSSNANGTFLWVALVCQELANIPRYRVQKKLREFPPGLDAAYRRMVNQICDSEDAELCKRILAIVSTVYRPIMLDELASFVDALNSVSGDYEAEMEIIGLCGSFLTLRERTVFFVHQSAKDFLLEKASNVIFPAGMEDIHDTIFSQSLQVMSKTLRRDVYRLRAPAFAIDQVKQPNPDPLAATRYSCVYWIHHLCQCSLSGDAKDHVQDGGSIDVFLRQHYLHWLEALSLYRSMSEGVLTIAKLEALIQRRVNASSLIKLVRDAHRFIMYHKWVIESSPLQAYASALMFSPARSLIRSLFEEEELKWITIKPAMGDKWSACLQTLENHSGPVCSVAFSHDSARLASGSYDGTVKIWDASSGKCLQTLGINKVPSNISFDTTGSYLRTESGTIVINASDGPLASNMTMNVNSPQKPQYQGVALSLDETWVTYNSEKLVWLPSEYRPSCSAASASGKMIGIGTGSGKVWIFKYDSSES